MTNVIEIKRPMLAATATVDDINGKIKYPVMCSPKLDGIRTFIHPTLGPVTRKLKPIPNDCIRGALEDRGALYGMDGELMTVDPHSKEDQPFNTVQSNVMSRGGAPLWKYYVFDIANPEPFHIRTSFAQQIVASIRDPRIVYVVHYMVHNAQELRELAETFVKAGYEGLMLRAPEGPYKEGRSTLNQQWLCKFKKFQDATGIVIGFEALQHNQNEADTDELGYTKRSAEKAGMVESATMLGALILHTEWGQLKVGTGFDQSTRELIWSAKDSYMGRKVDFKYQVSGMLELPRFPVFLRFRDD